MNTGKASGQTAYTYKSADGSTATIRAGEDGVTKKMIMMLRESDRETALQERYQEENTRYTFLNAECENPPEQIPDPKAEIERILFPEEDSTSGRIDRLAEAVRMLEERQQELIYELYGLRKSMADVAREQGVSYEAIQNRRGKIFRRLKKLLDERED